MNADNYLSWEEVQRLALPPNAALLIPPNPEAAVAAEVSLGVPGQRPDWLEDGYFHKPTEEQIQQELAAIDREENGSPAVRLLANMIAVNALVQAAQPRPQEDDEKKSAKKRQPEQ